MLKSIFPFDQSLIAEYSLHGEKEISSRLDLASKAFKSWRKTSFEERAALLKKAGAILLAKKRTLAEIITREMGKVLSESIAEIEKCSGACDYFSSQAEGFLADDVIQTDGQKSYVTYQPIGAVLAIMPWNFPFWQVFRFACPALMAGNVGLLKHAPNVSQCSLEIEKVFREAGFPEGVFQSLLTDVDVVEKIISHRIVQGVALTGSEAAGASVGAIAGKHIKKTVLELGGSDSFIVLEDADLEKAAKVATQSRMQNAGQSCIAAKRFIVVDSVRSKFIDLFHDTISKINQGNPFDKNVTMGPLARLDLADKFETQLNECLKKGARKIIGGERDGCNIKPVLLTDVVPGMPAYDEETFGPLAAVIAAKNEQEAIHIANDHRYGLGGAIWTQDLERGQRLAREIETGSVFINSLMRSDSRLPFGGTKKSGYGRELSKLGIHEFVNAKTIFVDK